MSFSSRRKPVLVTVTNEFGLGGVQLLHARVLPLLAERYETHLVGYRAKGVLFDQLPDLGVQTHFVRSHGRFHVKTLWDYRRLFQSLGADVIHAHGHSPNIFALLAGKIAGVPVRIGQIHSTGFHWFASSPFGRRKQAFEEALVQRLCGDAMVVISEEMRAKAMATLGLPDSAFALIHNGVPFPGPGQSALPPLPAEDGLRCTHGLAPDERLLGFVGRLVPEKGLDFLLDKVAHWHEAGLAVRVAVLGTGEPGFVASLQRRAAAIGDGNRVIWLGEQQGTHRYYPQFDALVFTSNPGFEGMATVVLEAASHGLPILARRAAPEEEVRARYSRMTFFDDHPSPVAALAATLALPPDESGRIAHFSISAMARRLDELYTALLARKRTTS